MAAAAVDDHRFHFESLPLIDLRLLTQSELLSLSVCSSNRSSTVTASQNDDEDELSTPKIDRSVFNESAGSRKQTFSRLRLAPRNSHQIPPQIPYAAPRVETLTLEEDNSQIVGLLESLFNIQSHSSYAIENNQQLVPVQVEYKAYLNVVNANVNVDEGLHDVPISVVTCSARKRKRGRPRKDEMILSDNWWLIESENKMNAMRESSANMNVMRESSANMNVMRESSANMNVMRESSANMNVMRESSVNTNVVRESSVSIAENVDVVACETTGKRKRGRPRKNENRNNIKVVVVSESLLNVGKKGPGRPRKGESKNGDGYVKKEIVIGENKEDLVNQAVMENRDGVAVDLVALANMENPFGEELRRRTEGSEKREELLGFLTGLKGVWVSLRKKRKIVDASEFGDVLPKGWKLMLCIKKKVGHLWLGCHRYISPNGQQFVSCKEVSSYLLSLSGVKDAKKPSAAHIGNCIQSDNKMTCRNAMDLKLKDDKNGVDLVFHSQYPTTATSTSAGLEKEAILPKIMSPGEVERQETCNQKYSVSNVTNEKLEKMDAATEVTGAKLGVIFGAETFLYKNNNNKHFDSPCEREVAQKTISSNNIISRQEEISQPRVHENSGNGINISSLEKKQQETGYESGFLSLNAEDKTSSRQNLDKRLFTSTMEHMKADVDKDVRNEAISSSGNVCFGLEDTVMYDKEQEGFEGCSTVMSESELKCGSAYNMNRLSASSLSPALLESCSESGFHASSGNVRTRTCIFNHNLTSVSSSMLHEPRFNGVNKSEYNELMIGFGNEHCVNEPGRPKDSEVGLLDLFGSEKIFGYDDNLTKVSAEKIEVPKLDVVRKSSEHAHGHKSNFRVATGTAQEPRLEDSQNARNSELMTDLSNHNRSGVDFMTELLWRTDEENILMSDLSDTSSRLLQSSGCFPAFGSMSDKGVSELFSDKYDSISGFEDLRPGSTEHMEYNFLTTQPSSYSEVSKILPYDAEMSQGFDSSGWLEKEALPLLPKIGSRHRVTTVCAWCSNEFHHEPIDIAGETGSVGFMCPSCKSRFSGSHNPM